MKLPVRMATLALSLTDSKERDPERYIAFILLHGHLKHLLTTPRVNEDQPPGAGILGLHTAQADEHHTSVSVLTRYVAPSSKTLSTISFCVTLPPFPAINADSAPLATQTATNARRAPRSYALTSHPAHPSPKIGVPSTTALSPTSQPTLH